MDTIYRIIDRNSSPETSRLNLVHDDGENITELFINQEFYREGTVYNLNKSAPICVSAKNTDINKYLFESSHFMTNPNATDYSAIPFNNVPGNYSPRIYRPLIKRQLMGSNIYAELGLKNLISNRIDAYDYFPYDTKILISSLQQLETIIQKLNSICLIVHPTNSNFQVFGHEIRNLLILACTEVEAQFKGILSANNYDKNCDNLKTSDYFKLCDILQLKEYRIKLGFFPDCPEFQPFEFWNSGSPTKSIVWYDNYNAVKHDREKKFTSGTFESVLNAVAAICVLLIAQYGNNIPYWKELIGNFFELRKAPKWELKDCYLPPFEENN